MNMHGWAAARPCCQIGREWRPAPQGGEDATAELPALSAYLPACPARHSRTAFKVLFTWSSGSIAVYS